MARSAMGHAKSACGDRPPKSLPPTPPQPDRRASAHTPPDKSAQPRTRKSPQPDNLPTEAPHMSLTPTRSTHAPTTHIHALLRPASPPRPTRSSPRSTRSPKPHSPQQPNANCPTNPSAGPAHANSTNRHSSQRTRRAVFANAASSATHPPNRLHRYSTIRRDVTSATPPSSRLYRHSSIGSARQVTSANLATAAGAATQLNTADLQLDPAAPTSAVVPATAVALPPP